MAINVNRNIDDAFYRYKMPRLLAKVEGKGNGIKTVVANMVDIAKALNRPPTYPTKYFGCELGAQTQFDLKNDRYIVNGDHDAAKLQDLLDGFIRKFVLCQECDNPETTLTVKGQKISLACKACGHVTLVDPRHRLTTFVIKNPPEPEPAVNENQTGPVVPGKVEKGKRGKNKRTTKDQGTGAAVENGNANGTSGSVEAEADGGRGSFENNSDEAGDDEDWAVDPEAAEERQKELVGNMANITMNDDLEKSIDDRMKIFMDYLKAKEKEGGQLDPKLVQIEAERLDVKDEAVLVICRVLFSDPNRLTNEQVIKLNRALFLRFTAKNDRAQRHLLGGLEQILVSSKKEKELLLPKLPRILETFYDADILEEKQILKWGSKTSSKYVTKEENKEIRAKAEPFLKWLQEAEEESDEGDEEDDGVEIVYDTKAPQKLQPQVVKTSQPEAVGHQQNGAAKEDDFDIDDI